MNAGWLTPFGHGYGTDMENHGKYFSKDIKSYYAQLIRKSEYRFLSGVYIDVLNKYYNILCMDSNPLYYCKVKQLIDIIHEEEYLKISDKEMLRQSYLRCYEKCSDLYNRYMTEVR